MALRGKQNIAFEHVPDIKAICTKNNNNINYALILIAENGECQPAQLSLEFRVFLVSAQTGKHTQESRTLRFWFRHLKTDNKEHSDTEQAAVAQDFFRELVSPQEFPRGIKKFLWNLAKLICLVLDYVGFIKKIMKLMQHNYLTIKKLEVELKQLQEALVPERPRK